MRKQIRSMQIKFNIYDEVLNCTSKNYFVTQRLLLKSIAYKCIIEIVRNICD